MRVLSFALALFAADIVVEAGVCKPARTTTAATSIVESSTATASATSEVSLTESLTSATETLSTDSSEILTVSTTLAETTTTEIASTTTEAASTTTEEASTTTTAGPSFTPGSIVGTGPVADLTLRGNGQRFAPLSFAPSDSTQTLIFSLVNGKLSLGNNDYLCLTYTSPGVLGRLVPCPFDNFSFAPLTCTRAASGTLSCTAPNGSCQAGVCMRPNNGIPFSQFYVDDSQNGYFGDANGNFGADYTAIDVILAE
ncbi:uncharacterized protein BKA55DRAFT_686477 [Fusarium redolens]|uniref:Uncharacterized protein n=1 Tax=Fusarium redolens TaxID=48865 RepID=A0A9P9HN73_FUSRE|nr:uncharacterized protein BKA55DRAFT_686477 [Fusarium redolens]KAH7260898.1 hypothetical protein BKA55DRAFT_686477 [Fusarium redolens]